MPSLADLNAAPPQLQSSLGAPSQPSSGGGGFSLFGWHPSLPNLGGVTAIKQLASGFIGLPEQAYGIGKDIFQGNGQELNPLNPNTDVGKFTYGFGKGVEDVATSAASVAGVPFTRYNLGDEVVAPLLQQVNKIAPTERDVNGNALPTFKPSSWSQRPGGPIVGIVQDLSTAAAVAGPVAGALGRSAGAAESAASAAEQAAAEGTGTAEAAAQASARASELANKAQLAHNFAHPYQFVGQQLGGLVSAARQAIEPAVSEGVVAAETPAEVMARTQGPPVMDLHEVGQALRDLQDPQRAAASVAARSDLENAQLANQRLLSAHPGEATTTLYHGQELPGSGPESPWWTSNPERAASYGKEQFKVEVPQSVADKMKTAAQEAAARGEGQINPKTDYYIDPQNPAHEDWARASQAIEPREGSTVKLPNAETNPRPGGATADAEAAINDRVTSAQASVPESAVAEEMARRIAIPPPQWAQRLTAGLPDSVNKVLGAFSGPVDRWRLNNVARDYARYVEVAQRVSRTSAAVQDSVHAAQTILEAVPGLERFDVSRMVGEEIGARMDGTAFVDSFIRTGGDPEVAQALHDMARRNYSGIPAEVRAQLSPEQSAAVESSLSSAVDNWREQARARLDTLLASSQGARGLEQAVLNDTMPTMTPTQVKAYRRAMSDLRQAAVKQSRIPEELAQREAAAQRQSLLAEKATAEADRLRAQIGIFDRTAETLHDSTPLALRPENLPGALQTLKEGIANNGITFDVGRNIATLPPDGVVVGIANQFDVPLEQFIAQSDDLLKQAMTSPVDPDGNPYGPGVFAGPDARLGAWVHVGPDGRQWVSAEISMSTWGGKPLQQWQAVVLGEAHRQEALWNSGASEEIGLSKTADVQNLMAHYAGDALNPRSDFSRFARQLSDTNTKIAGLPAQATDDALRMYATWDYALARSNPTEFTQGDFFKAANVSYGTVAPRNTALLAQTVLNLSTKDGVEQALANLTTRQVSDALAWYYDSHDYIESAYRGKTVTLLNGEQRDAAETFYDLLAVTSVMSSPKQNLGRALMGFSNMSDFLSGRKDGMAAAQSLMKKLDRISPKERGDLNGTSLSARFMTPEVRKLTAGTSMVSAPKYNVFDVLSGKLKLDQATNADIAALPEFWTGAEKSISAQNLDRAHVVDMMQRLGITGEPADRYAEWAKTHRDLTAIRDQLGDIKTNAKAAGYSPKEEVAAFLEGSGYSTQAELERAYRVSKGAEADLLKDPGVNRAFEQALQEHQGSNALAKLRSFRSNLSDPHNSTAVTLDSVMAHMYGFSNQDWAGGNTYGHYANEVRDQADTLSQRFGREVKPHEVQALLWSYTKQEIGRQDFGRLLAHHDLAQGELDTMQQMLASGQKINPKGFDPLGDYWDEELGYSRNALDQRQQRAYLTKQDKLGKLSPDQQAELASLKQLDLRNGIQEKSVLTTPPRENVSELPTKTSAYQYETRKQIPYDATRLNAKETQYGKYVDQRNEIQGALARGDVDEARRLLTSYVVKQRRGIIGDAEGGSFAKVGEETRNTEGDNAAVAEANLKQSRRVPAPNTWRSNFIAPLVARFNREHGLPEPTGLNLDAQVLPEATARVAQAVQDVMERSARGEIGPDEEAAAEQSYRALQQHVDQAYEYMTKQLGVNVQYVAPDQEYGIGTLGDAPQPDSVANAHAAMVHDIRANNNLKIRSTALAGDGPNKYMAETAPDGLMYNDKLRAVHDFFGHGQAANDFSRHGENIAQMLHLQMMDEAAKPAAISEFRAQTAYLVDRGKFLDAQLHNLLPDEMQQPNYMIRGNLNELHQQFAGNLRGATLLSPDPSGRLMIRMFQDAALDTLAHEGGHLLRQLLPANEMEHVLARYPHIADEALTPERNAAEEKFVSDMMFYIRQKATSGDATGMTDVFRRIAATMEEQHAAVLDSTVGRSMNNDIAGFWTRMFHPGIERPDTVVDPINMRRNTSLAGVETKQFPWESDAQFAQRARQYGEARARIETAQMKANLMARAASRADASARRMWAALSTEPGKIEAQVAELQTHAHNILDKLGAQLEDPKTGQVPQSWTPMWSAFQSLREQAKLDPRLSEYLDEIPDTFSATLRAAAERGIDPTHIPDITWERAQRLMFSHIQLGKGAMNEVVSGLRKTNNQVLQNAGIADRTIEGLSAGAVDATHELYSNKLIGFVEDNWAQPHTPGSIVPKGRVAWDPARDFILTGTDKRGEFVATNATMTIPAAVDRGLTSMSARYDHWAFHTLSKVTKPWITYNLTFSPKWYLHVAVSNVVRALAEGVTLSDWKTAWTQMRNHELPPEVYGNGIGTMMEDGHTFLGRSVKDAMQTEGVKSAITEVKGRVAKVHDVVDELSRGAVFEKTLRTTGSRQMALTRSYEAMVDYGALSPLERSAVRSLIPFYPFYKGMVKLLLRFPADHPAATSLLMLSGKMHEEYLQDKLGGALPQAYLGYANIGGLRNFTILDPFINPTHLVDVHQIDSLLTPFVSVALRDAYNAAEPGTGTPGMTATGQKVTQVNPAAALGQQLATPPITRAIAQVVGGGDVYNKSPSVAGTIGQYLGVPSTPDTAKIQATIEKTLGTLPKKGQPGYVPHPRSKKAATVHSTHRVRSAFRRARRPHIASIRRPSRPR